MVKCDGQIVEQARHWKISLHMQACFWAFVFNQRYISLSQSMTPFICGHLSKLISGRTSAEQAIHIYGAMFWKESLVLKDCVHIQHILYLSENCISLSFIFHGTVYYIKVYIYICYSSTECNMCILTPLKSNEFTYSSFILDICV